MRNFIFLCLLVFMLMPPVTYGALYSVEFPVATTAEKEFATSAAFDGTYYLVLIKSMDASGNNAIKGQFIDQNGEPAGDSFTIGYTLPGFDPDIAPRVIFDGTNYVVAYIDSSNNLIGGDV